MREAYGLENEDFLWAGAALMGGIGGQQTATCGAVAAAAVALGLRHRCPAGDKEKADKARQAAAEEAAELVKSFIGEFGAVSCIELTGVDLSDEKTAKQAFESGQLRCEEQVRFVVEELYELEKKRGGKSLLSPGA
jgi:C_GCAxxG_C_C family probable redox protein